MDSSKQICIITFYSGQVHAIKRELQSRANQVDTVLGDKLRLIRVVTVDSFQGSETDIILLSFVRSNIGNTVGFLSEFSRINVAMTRAKHLLVCVGNATTLENCGLEYLRLMVQDARGRGRLFPASDIDPQFEV